MKNKRLIGVYAIVNIVSQDFYIGSTFSKQGILGRLSQHLSYLRAGTHVNKFLQNSFNKYREEAFLFFPIEIIEDASQVRTREKFWVDELKPTFNGIEVGDGASIYSTETREKLAKPFQKYNASLKGKPASEKRKEQLEKARQAYKEKGVSEETREKLSKSNTGRKVSQEWKDNISASKKGKPSPMKGKHFSAEAKQNMSEAQKKRAETYSPSEETRKKMSQKHFSEEARERIAEASKRRWEKFRQEKQNKQE